MDYLKRNVNKIIKVLGICLIISGLFICFYHYFTIKKLETSEEIKIEEFFNEETSISEEDNTSVIEEVQTTPKQKDYDYIAVLEIPTISLKRGLVSPDSYYNKVNYNIQIIEHSTMPDVENGNLILAGHNGSSYVAFFNKLYKLNNGDKVYVYYNGYKYEYTIDNIYDTPKDGHIEIYRNSNKTTITLITCKKNTKDTQTVFIGYLTNKEQYS